jgi:hypothetical protein
MGNPGKGRIQDEIQEEQAHLPRPRPRAKPGQAEVEVNQHFVYYIVLATMYNT